MRKVGYSRKYLYCPGSAVCWQLDGLCFLVAYQLNSLFIFMMLFLFNVQLRNKYDDDDGRAADVNAFVSFVAE